MSETVSKTAFELALPDYVLEALGALDREGFEAWCVGGCIRDTLLARPVNDYDVATSSHWADTERALSKAGFAVHRTGTKHGTVTATLHGRSIEVTTFRTDGAYSDGRHPDTVDFVNSVEEDLARRDFTVNALAYHPQRGLLDCWGGIADMRRKTLRAVGDADARFAEDSLRILRGCRFRSQLGFEIEPSTLQAMKANKMRMLGVSAERITHELQELLLGPHVHDALVECVDVLGAVIPELVACKGFEQHTPYHVYDVLEHTAWVVQRAPATPLARWTALFHDLGKPGAFFMDGDRGHFYGHPRLSAVLARGIMERLCLPPKLKAQVVTLVRLHDKTIAANPVGVKRALAQLEGDVDLFRTLCRVKWADASAQSELSAPRLELARELECVLDEVIAAQDAFTVKQLAIGGNDVMSLGVPAGPAVGDALDAALEEVIEGRLPNERDALMAFLSEAALDGR